MNSYLKNYQKQSDKKSEMVNKSPSPKKSEMPTKSSSEIEETITDFSLFVPQSIEMRRSSSIKVPKDED